MTSTFEPSASQKARIFPIASGSAPSGGVRIHQRLTKREAKPASGPERSVPATGWAGMKSACRGRSGVSVAITAPLTEPTSDTIAPSLKYDAIARPMHSLAPTGAQRMTQSALLTALAKSLVEYRLVERRPEPLNHVRSE